LRAAGRGDITVALNAGGGAVGQVIVRNLEDEVIERHRERARVRGTSLEQELRDVLTRAARPDPDEYLAEMRRIRAMTPEPPPGQRPISAEELVRESRDSR
jgi:antitoxin FitA